MQAELFIVSLPRCYADKIIVMDLTNGALEEEMLPEKIYCDFIGVTGLSVSCDIEINPVLN